MFGKRNSKPQNRIDSLVSAQTRVDGDINFVGGLRVDGVVNGNVIASPEKPSTLVLSEHGHICGEVKVTHMVVNGTVEGPVHAAEYLELQGKAKVTGDIYYKTMEIQLGAIVEGRLMHFSDAASDKIVAFKLGGTESTTN